MNEKGASQESLNNVDAEISELIDNDLNRQNTHIHLIASENFASKAVMEASGSILTNKYSEGFPGRRYYEGCETVDQIEQLAIDRACEFLKLIMLMFNPIQDHLQIWQFICPHWNQGIPYLECHLIKEDTSHTVHQLTSQDKFITLLAMV